MLAGGCNRTLRPAGLNLLLPCRNIVQKSREHPHHGRLYAFMMRTYGVSGVWLSLKGGLERPARRVHSQCAGTDESPHVAAARKTAGDISHMTAQDLQGGQIRKNL